MPDSYYNWSVEGCPVQVELSLNAVDRLRDLVQQANAHSDPDHPKRGTETGGILLGRRTATGGLIIDDFEPLGSEHRRGASFELTPRDRSKLGSRIRQVTQAGARDGLVVGGYFRSHTRPGLYLDESDHVVIKEFFSDPAEVVLLVRPEAEREPEAGFFFWEDGQMDRRKTLKSFPFDRTKLLSEGPIVTRNSEETRREQVQRTLPVLAPMSWQRAATAVGVFAISAALVPGAMLLVNTARGYWAGSPRVAKVEERVSKEHSVQREAPHSAVPAGANQIRPEEPLLPAQDTLPPVVESPDSAEAEPTGAKTERIGRARGREGRKALHSTFVPPIRSAPTRTEHQIAALEPPSLPPESLYTAPKIPHLSSTRPLVTLEPVAPKGLRKIFGHLPIVSQLQHKRRDEFSPAKPLRRKDPVLPPDLARNLPEGQDLEVRIHIAKSGEVAESEVITKGADPRVADLAARTALGWDFEPARVGEKAVSSDMLLRFHFAAPATHP